MSMTESYISLLSRYHQETIKSYQLHQQVIRKFKRWKVYARFKNNIQVADLSEMGSLSSKNGGVIYLVYVTYALSKYVWVKPKKL